jgi:hypothetical protein
LLTTQLQSDKEVVMTALVKDGCCFPYHYKSILKQTSDALKNDKEVVERAILHSMIHRNHFGEYSQSIHNENEIKTINIDYCELQNASLELQSDPDFIANMCIKYGEHILYHTSSDLKNDRVFVMSLLNRKGILLEYFSEDLRADKEVVLEAVQQDGSALEFAVEEIKSDIEVVFTAVKQDNKSLQFANDQLKKDKYFILSVLHYGAGMLSFVSDLLRADKDFIIKALEINCYALACASTDLKNNPDVVLKAVHTERHNLEAASNHLRNDKGFMLKAVRKNGRALSAASKELKNDKEVVQAACNSDVYSALKYASKEIRNDKKFILKQIKMLKASPQILMIVLHYSSSLLDDKEVVIAALNLDAENFHYLPHESELRNDPEIKKIILKSGKF